MQIEPLRIGDLVDVVAPASRCRLADLKAGVRALEALGLEVRVPKNLFASAGLFSNTDAIRLKHLHEALTARDSKMVWCLRGGYGALRLLPQMKNWRRPLRPKIFLGYSDITTLHSFLNQSWGWPTLHGPLLDRFGRGVMSASERQQLLQTLFGQRPVSAFRLVPMNSAARQPGRVKAKIRGGNLAVLQSGLGTSAELQVGKHMLFLEDTGERPHRVDRMLSQLEQAGKLHSVRAIVFGHFLLAEPKDRRQLWHDVMARFAQSQKIPVLKGLPVGHNARRQMTLALNTHATLTLGHKPNLAVESGLGS